MTTEEKRAGPVNTVRWERVEAMTMFCAGYTTEQLQAGSLGELVGALKKAPHPPMHAAVWNFDLYIEWAELRDAALAPFKGGNDEA